MNQLKGLKGFSAWSVYNKVVFNLVFIREFNIDKEDFLSCLARLCTEKNLKKVREGLPQLAEFGAQVHKTPQYCIEQFKSRTRAEKTAMIVEALTFADLDDDEVMRLLALHDDQNGMPYGAANINNLEVGTIFNMIVETMLNCSDLTCDFSLMSQKNQDDLGSKRVSIKEVVADILQHNGDLPTEDLIALAVKKTLTQAQSEA